jgi:putative cell wall-binding protein
LGLLNDLIPWGMAAKELEQLQAELNGAWVYLTATESSHRQSLSSVQEIQQQARLFERKLNQAVGLCDDMRHVTAEMIKKRDEEFFALKQLIQIQPQRNRSNYR